VAGESECVVVGAGPAGLAAAACLRRAGVDAVVLEQAAAVGSAWRSHYDRLHLHTDRSSSALPFMRFDAQVPRYPSRRQVVDYLESYARAQGIAPRFGVPLESARRVDDGWNIRTGDGGLRARNLVFATGYTRVPALPDWAANPSFRGEVLHSSAYRNGAAFEGRRVLVVGFGNSGGEIAMDLHEHGARADIAIRSPVNVVPRDLFGLPILTISIFQSWMPPALADALNAPVLRIAVGDLSRYGVPKPRRGALRQIRESARVPLIDVGTVRLIKRGDIGVRPGVAAFTEDGVRFADGRDGAYDAVVLATGYRPRLDALLPESGSDVLRDGAPLASGTEAAQPGLFFCGYRVAATGMLREIGIEARRIAAAVAARRARGAR
jgi:indole-3-pyruvate monooxygenase